MKDDSFGMRCRGRTKQGKRCSRRAKWLTSLCVSRESWLAALRTGWPRCIKGMKEPEYRKVGTCTAHIWNCTEQPYLYGIGHVGRAKKDVDPEYDEASALGDQACLAWRQQLEWK